MQNRHKIGAHVEEEGVRFAVYSEHADKIELCLFDETGLNQIRTIDLTRGEDNIWHGFVPDIGAGQLYGYRAHGEYQPAQGKWFDPSNILLDPYAYDVLQTSDDQGERIIRGRVADTAYDWGNDQAPNTPWEQTIFYEIHAKGFTKLHPDVPEETKGTIAGLADPVIIKHLKELGVTSVELLPVHSFLDEDHLKEKGRSNYWGYNTIGFFAPHAGYLATGTIDEFKDVVKAYHEAGLEVILDVVYNHTAEGGADGPVVSFRGLDNEAYYRLYDKDGEKKYVNETGCGNTVNITNPAVTNMVVDSLRYWVDEFHIDGFRFDLASSLARNPEKFSQESAFLEAVKNDPVLSNVKLVAEPWDVGPDGYQVGAFPAPWREWNDKYRDHLRSYWRSDAGSVKNMAKRIAGSSDKFGDPSRGAHASVNHIAVHDGFNLNDLVSYNDKHNEANGEENRDGHSHNFSANNGHEGKTDDPHINEIRLRQKKNMLASLFMSQGVPLLLGGDEFGNTQNGNNNAYCQDNEIGWINWDNIDADGEELLEFTKKIIAFRKENPVFTYASHLHGLLKDDDGVPSIDWYNADGRKYNWDDAYDKCFAVMFNNAALPEECNAAANKDRLFVIFNSSSYDVDFELPALAGGSVWTKKFDTSKNVDQTDKSAHDAGSRYKAPPKSLTIFTQKPG